jgi:pimeloyl-ACP methyl ester carboxylesterase
VLIRVGELDTFYQADGQGPPVVLLHGWGTSGRSLEGVAAGLADRFRVVRLDLPGFGWSQAPPAVWGIAEYATHVRGCLEGLGIGRAALVGHSFGGRLAIRLAATEPARVARLGLVASAGIRPPRTLGLRARVGMTKLLRFLAGLPGLGPAIEPFRERWVARVGSRDYRAAGRLRPILVKVVGEDLRDLLPRIAAPTLLLWGDEDPEVDREAMEILAAGIRGARLMVFPGAGHFPFDDAPTVFLRTLRGFLEEGERW